MAKSKRVTNGTCKLCQETNCDLVDSHIIPDFVIRWLRDISTTKHLRTTNVPNRRTERGLTRNWLCSDCDNKKFGDSLEDPFAKEIFYPTLNSEEFSPLTYDSSLLRFCVSVLWRVLLIGIEDAERKNKQTGDKPPLAFIADLQDQADFWREFLVDENAEWKGQNVYLLRLGCEGLRPEDIGPRMNVYSKLSIDMSTHFDPFGEPIVYAKMGPFIICTPFIPYYNAFWTNGGIFPISPDEGILSCGPYKLPDHFKNFLISQANIADEIYRKLSETQKNMIDDLKEIHYTDFIKSEENVLILLDMLESQANNPE